MKKTHLGGTEQGIQGTDDFMDVMNSLVREETVEIIKKVLRTALLAGVEEGVSQGSGMCL